MSAQAWRRAPVAGGSDATSKLRAVETADEPPQLRRHPKRRDKTQSHDSWVVAGRRAKRGPMAEATHQAILAVPVGTATLRPPSAPPRKGTALASIHVKKTGWRPQAAQALGVRSPVPEALGLRSLISKLLSGTSEAEEMVDWWVEYSLPVAALDAMRVKVARRRVGRFTSNKYEWARLNVGSTSRSHVRPGRGHDARRRMRR